MLAEYQYRWNSRDWIIREIPGLQPDEEEETDFREEHDIVVYCSNVCPISKEA